jgi:hypothetical protein
MKIPEIKEPNAPATSAQTMYIRRLSGVDVRPQQLSRGAASELIKKLLAEQQENALENSFPGSKTPVNKAKRKSMAKDELGVEPKRFGGVKKPLGPNYPAIMREAVEAANAAGDVWWNQRCAVQPYNPNTCTGMKVGPLDLCGFAFIEINDKRTKFVKWYMKQNPREHGHFMHIPHKFDTRQDMGLREVCMMAALEVFRKHDVAKGLSFYSRVD